MAFTHTTYPNAVDVIHDKGVTPDSDYNVNLLRFEDKKDIIMAAHVLTLQEMVVSIEQTLGANPQINPSNVGITTVAGRLSAIENSALKITDVNGAVNAHKHIGGASSPSQIDLTTEVKNKLPRANVNLSFSDSNGIKASDIYYSSTKTVADMISSSFGVSGGTITGDTTINGSLSVSGAMFSSSFAEINSDYFKVVNGQRVTSFSGAWQGKAVKNATKTGTAAESTMLTVSVPGMRYNTYVATFRTCISSVGSPEDVAFYIGIMVGGPTNKKIYKKAIQYKHILAAGKWQTFYIRFDYDGTEGGAETSEVGMFVNYIDNSVGTIYIDGIVLQPAHTAVFDMVKVS